MASDQGAEAEEDAVSSGAATAEEAQPLTSSHEFYKAHAELEAEVTAQAEEKYRSYARDLDSYAATVDELREQVSRLSLLRLQHCLCSRRIPLAGTALVADYTNPF